MRRWISIAHCLLPIACLACSHDAPWQAEAIAPNPVLDPVPPRQLTFSPEGDWAPVWLPDGSAFGYSYHPLERRDRDRCLGFVPPEGGRVTRSLCIRGPRELDSSNVVSFHAASPGGRLAVVAEAGNPLSFVPDTRYLYLTSTDGSAPLKKLVAFPHVTASGRIHYTALFPTWVDEQTLVYLAGFMSYYPGALGIPADTVTFGIELVRVDLAGDTVGARTILAGTLGVSSVTRGTLPGTVAYTRGGNTAVHQLDLATGVSSVLYDFGALGIARDVQLDGRTVVAVVGGRVSFTGFDAVFGIPVQADSGGPIYAVELPSGPPRLVIDTVNRLQYRRPALAPGAARVVAETFRLVPIVLAGQLDTVVSKEADLWLFQIP